MLKFRAVPRRLFSYGKPLMVEDWELTVASDEKKSVSPPPTERFTKSFQEYLDTRLTLDEMMKTAAAAKKKATEDEEIIRLATMKLDGRMFYSEEDGRWHPLKEKKGPNSNDNSEPVCDP
jgi:hypothetical protein